MDSKLRIGKKRSGSSVHKKKAAIFDSYALMTSEIELDAGLVALLFLLDQKSFHPLTKAIATALIRFRYFSERPFTSATECHCYK
jgi:hypothetical protein